MTRKIMANDIMCQKITRKSDNDSTGRVTKLTSLVEDKETHKVGARSHEHVVDMAHPAESHAQASSAEVCVSVSVSATHTFTNVSNQTPLHRHTTVSLANPRDCARSLLTLY